MSEEVKPVTLNPNATHWCISGGRNPDGSRAYTVGQFGPFCREDDATWWRGRVEEPSLGWAPTVEEAWRRWEEQMTRWAAEAERKAADLRLTVKRMHAARNGGRCPDCRGEGLVVTDIGPDSAMPLDCRTCAATGKLA